MRPFAGRSRPADDPGGTGRPPAVLVLWEWGGTLLDEPTSTEPATTTLRLWFVSLTNGGSRHVDVDLSAVLAGPDTVAPASNDPLRMDAKALLHDGSLIVRTYQTGRPGGDEPAGQEADHEDHRADAIVLFDPATAKVKTVTELDGDFHGILVRGHR